MRPDEYDPRIVMVAGLRPAPAPVIKPRWPKILGLVLGLPILVVGAVAATVFVLARDPALPRIDKAADYHPPALTRFYAASGEQVAEVGGARRTVLPGDRIPAVVMEAVVARRDPGFLDRAPMGVVELARSLIASTLGKEPPAPLSLGLARSLAPSLPDVGLPRLIKEWATAFRLEHSLSHKELAQIYVNQVAFGPGIFGIEEGARARFGRSVDKLDAGQIAALAEHAGSETGHDVTASTLRDASGCGAEAVRRLGERYDPQTLARLGAKVVTPCDPALTRTTDEIIHKQHLERSNLSALVVVARVPSHEVAVIATGDDQADAAARAANAGHPMALLRVPVVVSAALESLKFNLATPIDQNGQNEPLRSLAIRNPAAAADALVAAGLSRAAIADVAAKLGLRAPVAEDLLTGKAPVTALEVATMYGALAAGGQRRLAQLWTTIDGKEESEATRAPMQAVSPEVAFLLGSISPVSPAMRARIKQTWGGFYANSGKQTWVAVSTPQRVVVVWIGAAEDATLRPGVDAGKAALAIAGDVLAAAHRGLSSVAFERPPALVARRIDAATGRLLKASEPGGAEEWFLPGSLPKEEPELPPETELHGD